MHKPVRTVDRQVWRDGSRQVGARTIPEETALALTYNGGTYAVMMGTPQNLTDFAVGFSLSEGIVQSPDEIESIDLIDIGDGIELRMWLADEKAAHLSERRRQIAGPTGCGLCGIDSIAQAVKPAATVPQGRQFSQRDVMMAMQGIPPLQEINIETRAVHAAAFWTPAHGVVALREDVGRHNALDKLCGALSRAQVPASDGLVLLTSRVSVEMVQKAASLGAPIMVAVSAPTALAVRMADAAGITLIAIARADGFEVFTHSGGSPAKPPPRDVNWAAKRKSKMSPDRLIHMANQIGQFFRSQGQDKAVPGIADHIKKFWDPRMRSAILAHLDAGGEGLDGPVRDALATLKKA